jgi:hypothetical protein
MSHAAWIVKFSNHFLWFMCFCLFSIFCITSSIWSSDSILWLFYFCCAPFDNVLVLFYCCSIHIDLRLPIHMWERHFHAIGSLSNNRACWLVASLWGYWAGTSHFGSESVGFSSWGSLCLQEGITDPCMEGVMVILDCQLDCIERHLKHTSGCACEDVSRDNCHMREHLTGKDPHWMGTTPSNRLWAWIEANWKKKEAWRFGIFLFASWPSCSELRCSTTCSPQWCSASLQANSNGASGPWTKTSESMSQNKSFLLLNRFSQVFVTVTKHGLRQRDGDLGPATQDKLSKTALDLNPYFPYSSA